MHSVCLGTVLLKDEELARYLEYGKRLTEYWQCTNRFCCEVFFCLLLQLRTVIYYVDGWVNIFLSANYIMLTSFDKYFLTTIFSSWILDGSWVLRGSLFTQFLSMTISWRHISQGRVATNLRCGGIFNYHVIANLSRSLTMKEFWKSIKIW